MSYIITLRDGTTHKLGDDDAWSLRDRWETERKTFPVRLGEASVLSSQIVSIDKEKVTEADWLTDDVVQATKRLEAKDRCRGQYSIQNEINHIARDIGGVVGEDNPEGRKWTKLIRSKTWRARMREKLLATNAAWCDHWTNTCVCEPEFLADKARHNSR